MNCYDTPTINEIRYQRESQIENTSVISIRPNKFKVGQIVRFVVDSLIRVGRISNAMCRNGVCSYHIETAGGTWYREIAQDSILKVIQPAS